MGTLRTLLLLPSIVMILAACGGAKPASKAPESGAAGSAPHELPAQDKRAEVMRLFMEATQARLSGKNAQAMQRYQQVVKLDPENGAALFELGKLHHQGQQPGQAIEFAKRAVAAEKSNIWYRFLLADLYQQGGRPEDAADVYRGIIGQWPDRYEVYFDLANTLAYSGKVTEALKVYEDIEKRFGLNEQLIMQQFGMLATNGRLDEAEELVKRAVAAHPDEPAYLGLLAELYDERGEHDLALQQYQKALEIDPGNSLMRVSLAEHYYGTGRHEEAFEQLGIAFEDPEMDIDAKMQVLIGFFEMSNFEGPSPNDRPDLIRRSYALVDALEQAHPESGKPHTIHGDFLLRDGRYEEAREQFRKALLHEQERFPIWLQLLQLDLQLGDHEALHRDAEDATMLFPTVPEIYLYNGIALSQLERHEEAVDALIAGRDLVVDNPVLTAQFWSSLGDAYNGAKQYEKSDHAFDKALAIEPDNPNTLNNFAYYLSVRGEQMDKAERMSKRSNELAPGQPSYLDTYAWVLFRMGRFQDARSWIEKALLSGGSDQGVIVEHYGDILFMLGDATAAMEQWLRARDLGQASEALPRKIELGTWVE